MRKLAVLGVLVMSLSLLLGGGPVVVPAAAQQDDEIQLDSIEDLVPCCESSREFRGAVPESTTFREVHEPGGVFTDAAAMERMAAEGRRRSPLGRAMAVADRTTDPTAARAPFDPLAPALRKKFNGLSIAQGGGWVPPDTQLAVGPEHVLQAVNVAFRLSSKTNSQVIVQAGEDHFGTGDSLFDPKVYYDPLSGRFFIIIMDLDEDAGRSRVYLSVSRSSTPDSLTSADWCSYFFNAKKKGAWADYPGLGASEDWLAVSTNNFRLDNFSFSSAWLWVMDKAKLVNNTGSCPGNKVFAYRVAKDKSGETAFTLQPSQNLDNSGRGNGELHVVASQPVGFSEQYGWWTVAANTGGKPKVSSRMIDSAGYAFPPDAEQKGGSRDLDTIGSRLMQQAVVVDGNLWLAHTSGCTFSGTQGVFSCIRVARIPVGAGATDFEDLFGVPGSWLWVPGLALANNGDAIVTFQMSGDSLRLSTGLAGLPGGAARFGPLMTLDDEFDSVKPVFKGKCPTELGNPVRTGDYIGAATDPVTDDVWISGEFGAKVSGTCAWNTKIARVSY